jgi:hypothetical protein
MVDFALVVAWRAGVLAAARLRVWPCFSSADSDIVPFLHWQATSSSAARPFGMFGIHVGDA